MINSIFIAFGIFFLKHFIVDFPLQRWAWMYKNKGTWGHPGGIVHAGLHGLATFLILVLFIHFGMIGHDLIPLNNISMGWLAAAILGGMDGYIHYVIDWSKMNLNSYMEWGPLTSEWFWHLLGLDQMLHNLTYLIILWIWFS